MGGQDKGKRKEAVQKERDQKDKGGRKKWLQGDTGGLEWEDLL